MGEAVEQLEGAAPASPATPATLFFTRARPFACPVDGRVATLRFLEGASGVVALVEQLGKVFAPVRFDMNGNIEKITNKYKEDTARFEFLDDLLVIEQAQGSLRAADALLWLRRALHFFHEFLLSIVKDTKAGRRKEDLAENIQTAYRDTLQKHHGFLAQRLFSVLSKMVPSRSKLLKTIALGSENSEDPVICEIEEFLLSLNSNLLVLEKVYEDLRLNVA